MRIKEHLLKFHLAAAEHSARLAKLSALRSADALEHHDALPDGHEMCKYLKATADHHDTAAGIHQDHAVAHRRFAKSLEARGDDEYLPGVDEETDVGSSRLKVAGNPWGGADKIMPDKVRGVVPTIPDALGTLIPRPGGPEVNTEGVDPQLAKLFKSD